MGSPTKRYWFPAKRHGWGWSLPTVWQGWAVLVAYLVALVAISSLVPRHANRVFFWALVALATALFVVIVWRKGEPPG